MATFDLTKQIKIVNSSSNVDALYGTYSSISEALTNVPVGLRALGRTVGIIEGEKVVEYWFQNGITDSDLILKVKAKVEKVTGYGVDNTDISNPIVKIPEVYDYQKVQYPLDFTFRPFSVYELNERYFTSFSIPNLISTKISKLRPYYVDFVNGSNSNGGTETSPFKTITYALQQGAKLIYLEKGIHQTSTIANGTNNSLYGSDDKFIIARDPSQTYITSNLEGLIWSVSGSIYSTPTSGNLIGGVVDFKYSNTYGLPATLTLKASTAEVTATPGSYYFDSSNNLLYINTFDSRVPDSNIIALLSSNGKSFNLSGAEYVYFEGITFMGGANALTITTQTTPAYGNALINGCKFLYARDNGFRVTNTGGVVWSNRCMFYDNGRDGANYTQSGVTTQKIIETYNLGWDNGVRRANLTEYAMNGSSVHNDVTILRIECKYWGNFGPNVNDVGGSRSFNIGVECFDSKGLVSSGDFVSQNGDFATSIANGTVPSKMWLYGCKSKDGVVSFQTPKYANNSPIQPETSTLYVDKSTYVSPYKNNIVFGEFVSGSAPTFNFPSLSSYTAYNPNGTVTNVSVATANGVTGTVSNPTTTPTITLDISSAIASAKDVIAVATVSALPATGAAATFYVITSGTDINKVYRWDGTAYVQVNSTSGGVWGTITGNMADQADLAAALLQKIGLTSGSPVTVRDSWYGTQAQYDALGTYNTQTEYNIEITPILLSGNATLDFPSTSSASSSDLTITVTGAALGDPVAVGVPSVSVLANTSYSGFVSATDTVTVRFNNYSALSANPASGLFKVRVFK